MNLVQEKLDEIVAWYCEREEKELYAAWRAGYKYLFKLEPHGKFGYASYKPSDRPKRFRTNQDYRVVRYNLGDVDDDVVMEAYNRCRR